VTSEPKPSGKLTGSALRRPGIGLVVLASFLLVLALGLFLIHNLSAVGGGVTLTALALAIISTVPALAVVAYCDRREPEPWWVLALLFVWGAVVATALSLILQSFGSERAFARFNHSAALVDTSQLGMEIVSLGALYQWLVTSLIAPITEEAVKGFAVVLVFLLLPREVNTMRDGVIVGAMVGIGFTVTEATAFIISDYPGSGENAYLSQLIPRFALLGVSGHIIFTALFGAGVGWARESTAYGRVRRAAVVFGTFLLGLAAHSMYNAFGPYAVAAFSSIAGWGPTVTVFQLWVLSLLEVLSTYGWAYVVLVYFLFRSGHGELSVIRTELRIELPHRITPEEYSLVEAEGVWRMRRIPWLSRRESVRLVRAQNRLAFQLNEARRDGGDLDADPWVEERREGIEKLRASEAL
jgi:protease PrsW